MEYKIIKSTTASEDYFELLEKLYGEGEVAQGFISDTRKGLGKATLADQDPPLFFYVYKEDELVGHIALIPYVQGEAFFGFFECVDTDCFEPLWNELVREAKEDGFHKLTGPVNGTIWHPYRFISKTSKEPYFPSEPLSNPDYNNLFLALKPIKTLEYHSAYRTDFTTIINATKASYQNAMEDEIAIEIEAPGAHNIFDLYQMAVDVFSVNPGYTHLSMEEFVNLYSNEKLSKNKSILYSARAKGKLIGFCLNLEFENTSIMKTIAVLPEWQQKGVGNALVHKIHMDAVERGITKMIYALIRKDNKVKHFPHDKITIFREYSAHIFNV
jgi:ribosomal protein S18 acetylase RimI-like enzyme